MEELQLHQQHQQALLILLQEFDRVCKKLDIPYVLFAGTLLGAVRHHGFIPWDDDLDIVMLRQDYDRFLREAEQHLDTERFFLQKEFTQHWPMFFSKLRLNNTTCLEKYHPRDPETHQGVYMDIFPCDNAADTHFKRKLQFYASKVVIAKSLYRRGYDTGSKKKKLFMALCRLLPAAPFLYLAKQGSGDSEFVHTFFGGASAYGTNVYVRQWFTRRIELPFETGAFPVPEAFDPLLRQLYQDYMVLPPEEQRKIKQHAILIDLDRPYTEYQNYRDGMKFDVHTRSIR